MAFAEMWIEVARQRGDDLRREGRRVGSARTATARVRPSGRGRAALLVQWLRHGQLRACAGIAVVPDAPLAARTR